MKFDEALRGLLIFLIGVIFGVVIGAGEYNREKALALIDPPGECDTRTHDVTAGIHSTGPQHINVTITCVDGILLAVARNASITQVNP